MKTPSNNPITTNVLVNLLEFFSYKADQQLSRLKEYEDLTMVRKQKVNVNRPLIELAEALTSLCSGEQANEDRSIKCKNILGEIGAILDLILFSSAHEFASPESLVSTPYWEVIRRLCADALLELGRNQDVPKFTVWDLLSLVSD